VDCKQKCIEGYEQTISARLIYHLFLGDRTNKKVINLDEMGCCRKGDRTDRIEQESDKLTWILNSYEKVIAKKFR
jgi:hypothetical protein